MRLGISTKVFLGFAAVIASFGISSVYGLLRIAALRENIVFIRAGVLPVADQVRDLSQSLRGFSEALERRRQSDLEWQRSYLPGLQPFARIERLAERVERMIERPALQENDQDSLRVIRAQVTRLRDGSELHESLAADEVQRAVLDTILARVSPPHTNQQVYEAYAKSFVQLVNEGRPEAALHVQSGLRTILRQMRKDVVTLQRDLERAVDAIHARAEDDEERAMLGVLVVASIALLVSLLVMWLTHLAIRRVKILIEGVRTVSRGDYGQVVLVRGYDEIGQLAGEFNHMATSLLERDRMLQAQREELLRADRLATIGKMSAQITHELRNPLSSIGLNAELIEEDLRSLDDPSMRESISLLQAIGKEVDRLTDVTEQYLRFAKLPKPELEEEDLVGIVRSLLAFMREELLEKGIAVNADLPATLLVLVDENQVRQALLNVLRNAAEALSERPGGGSIHVSVRPVGAAATVEIRDDGPGIPAAVRDKIFDPFFTSKRSGTGLGLALVHQIVREHGGSVRCDSEPGAGATFTLTFPLPAGAP